jgi:hypothetical protein
MKAPQQHGKPTDADAKAKPGNKIQCLKPGKYSTKSSGDVLLSYFLLLLHFY